MPGIVTIVDGAAGDFTRWCWELLERELGLAEAPPGAIPHVSYHVSDCAYRAGPLVEEIDRAIDGFAPFAAASTGLGVFAGEPAVLYLAVTRTAELSRLQQAIWQAAEPHSPESFAYGQAGSWVPHITLAMEGLTPEVTGQAVALLLPKTRAMALRIANIALLDELTGAHQLVRRWDLAASKVAEK